MELIERIRRDIQHRLDAVLSEADKLRKALAALDPRGSSGSAGGTARPQVSAAHAARGDEAARDRGPV